MRIFRLLVLTICLGVVLVGCQKRILSRRNIDEYSRVIAVADPGYSLTMRQLYDAMESSKVKSQGGILSTGEVRGFLDSLLTDTLAGLDANELDISNYYQQYQVYKRRYQDYLVRVYIRDVVYDKVEVDSSEVVQYYHDHPEFFSEQERILLSHILIAGIGLKNGPDSLHYRSLPAEELAEATEAYAHQIVRKLDSGQAFEDVARKYSHDQMAGVRAGFVGWVPRGVYKDPFDSVAFSLEPGAYSRPYQDSDGWHIVYVADYMAEGIPPLDANRFAAAQQNLASEKANALAGPLIDSLEQEIHLEHNEAILDTNVYFVDRSEWAAILNGVDTIEFNELRGMEEPFRRKYKVANTTVEMKREMILNAARRLIFVQAARAAGTDTLPAVRAQEQSLRHGTAKSLVLQNRRDPGWQPSDKEIEKYYRKNLMELTPKKPLRVQHIVTDDSLMGEFLRDQARAGVDFLDLAQEYYPGDESIRRDLANLGDIGPEDVPEPFYQAALLTPVGGVTHPVATKYGYHVIKVLSRREAGDASRVRHKILPILKERHQRKVFERFRDDLYSRYNVRFPSRLYPVHLKPLELRGNDSDEQP